VAEYQTENQKPKKGWGSCSVVDLVGRNLNAVGLETVAVVVVSLLIQLNP